MIGLDTDILVRYFTHDDARQTSLALRLVDEQLDPTRPGHISLVTLAELVWVLRTVYGAERETVIDIVSRLLGDARFVTQASSCVWAALDAYRNAPIDFGDALIAALNRDAGCLETLTFDRGAARIAGVRLLN